MPSFISLFDSFVLELLFPLLLDPHHLGDLRLVNKALAKCINENVRKRSVAAALAKYEKMIILSDDTVRIHSCLGKTVIDLTLPTGKVHPYYSADLFMQLDGRKYRGQAELRRCQSLDGQPGNFSNLVFHAKSYRLFRAESVFIVRQGTVLHGNDLTVKVFVHESNRTWGYLYTLHFVPLVLM